MVDAPKPVGKEYAAYTLNANGVEAHITIVDIGEFVPAYKVSLPGIGEATRILIISLRQELLRLVPIDTSKISDAVYMADLHKKYTDAASVVIDRYLPGTDRTIKNLLVAYIINTMLGLGDLEVILADENLEEVAVNSSKEGIWVFHKKFGWCKSDLKMYSEQDIYEHSEQIGRRIGRSISTLTPLMDAELSDGSRVNATLYPVSQGGNTITIRKFSKNPWTMTALIANGAVSPEIASLIWLCVQNEISLLVSGGTASGKTSFLNAMSIFMPSNHRVISIEETRELTLPTFLQWVPMLSRQANAEGKGEISLYNLMINALRQRPDIVVVGEIRTKWDAQTLFEAIHTGHAVYGTMHADNSQDAVIRMTNPPIELPKVMLNAMGGVISLFRHRRLGIRRVLEFAEITNTGDANVLYRWNLRNDTFISLAGMTRLAEVIALYGGYTYNEILEDVKEKSKILNWMVSNKVTDVDNAGYIIANYYKDKASIIKLVDGNVAYRPGMLK